MILRSAIAFALLGSACAGGATPLSPDTGTVVEVTLWPVNPVEIEGQPAPVRPVAGARIVAFDADGDAIARDTTDEKGRARILLAPGAYEIRVVECPGAMSGPKEDGTITVSAGAFTAIAFTCDSGIR
ncbi:MAG TPA: carboxypeptidase-like regulatory domain-containing protein [Longimicrobiales bacterium]